MSKTERNLRNISFPLKNNRNEQTNHERSFHRNLVELFHLLLFVFILYLRFPSFLLAPSLSRTLTTTFIYQLPSNALIFRAAALSPEFIEAISRLFQHLARRRTLCGAWNHRWCFQYVITTTATTS